MSQPQRRRRVALTTRLHSIAWPCRDEYTGSLHPVPPGNCRRDMFCSRCSASICIFGGTPAQRRLGKRRRCWSLPDLEDLDTYLDALRLYTGLLAAGRTCWRCVHLRHLRGAGDRYVCAHPTARGSDGEGESVAVTAWQAQLSTSLEVCGDAAFQERRGSIPQVPLAEWRALVDGRRREGFCAWCSHLVRFLVAGRDRFVCALEAEGLSEAEVWRRGRSWKVARARRGDVTWCRGERWEQAPPEREALPMIER